MRRRHLSIFSSDTLNLRGTPLGWWLSLSLALLIVAAGELGVRALLGPGLSASDYWDEEAGRKYEWYRARETAPQVLVIGDSSAARNFTPLAMEEALGSRDVFNLGTPGSFPLALSATAYRLLERPSRPEVVIVSQVIHSFYDSQRVAEKESLIIESRAARYLNDRRDATDYIALARAYDNRALIVSRLLGQVIDVAPPVGKGFVPHDSTGRPIFVPDGYFSDADPGADRIDTVIELAKMAQAKNFKLIFALPVQFDKPAQKRIARHRQWLLDKSERYGFAVLDMRSVAALSHDDFSDVHHLNRAGAEKQSRALGQVLNTCLAANDWRSCLMKRPVHEVELVDGPRWIPDAAGHASSPDNK